MKTVALAADQQTDAEGGLHGGQIAPES